MIEALFATLKEKHYTISCAESCTGGLLADAFVALGGASEVFAGSAVFYMTPTKTMVLGVPKDIIAEKTVVSSEVALAMAEGCRALYQTDIGLSSTGLAGPATPSDPAPVGTVYIGIVTPKEKTVLSLHLEGNRKDIRHKAAEEAIAGLYRLLKAEPSEL